MTEGASLLSRAAAGDMACCERIRELSTSLLGMVDTVAGAEGAIAAFLKVGLQDFHVAMNQIGGIVGGIVAAPGQLADAIGLSQLHALVAGAIDSLGATAVGWIDAGLNALGSPPLTQLVDRALDWAARFVSGALGDVDGLVADVTAKIAEMSEIDSWAGLGDTLVEAADAARWLAENWGNETLWATDGADLHQRFAVFGDALRAVMFGWAGVQGAMSAGAANLTSLRETIAGWAKSPLLGLIVQHPLGKLAATVVVLLNTAGDPLWGELATGVGAAAGWIGHTARTLVDVGAALAASTSPLGFATVMTGTLLGQIASLPACYQEPIIDVLLGLSKTTMSVFIAPLGALGPLGAWVHTGMLGFFDQLDRLAPADKLAMLVSYAGLLQLNGTADLVTGFLAGLGGALVDELVGVMLVIGGACAAVFALMAAIPSALAALVAGLALAARDVRDAAADEVGETESIDDDADVDADVDAGAAVDADVEATLDVSDLAQAAAAPPTPAAPATLEGIHALIGEGMAALNQAATSLGEQLAARVQSFLLNADDSLYAVGSWGGWAVATATVGLLSAAATGCASLIFKFVTKLGPILRFTAAGARTLRAVTGRLTDAYRATSALFDELLSGLNRLSKLLPISWFLDLIAALRVRLLGYLARITLQVAKLRAKHAKSRRKAKRDRQKTDPNGKGKDDDAAEGANVTSAANRAAKAVYSGAAKTLLTPARAATLARGSLAEPGLKAEVVITERTWRVRVARPKRGTVAAAAATSTTSGWVATEGTNGAGAAYIGATDPTGPHENALKKLHTAYEAEWQALCQTVDRNEHSELAGRKTELAKLIQADIAYDNAKLSVTLTNQRYGDAPTVTWTATIAPNATEIVRPLTAVGTASRWDDELGRFVPDTERAAVRRALEAQTALNAPDATWAGHAVPYLLGQPPFVSPLSGGLSVAGLHKVVSECQVVREGSARDYDSAIHFGNVSLLLCKTRELALARRSSGRWEARCSGWARTSTAR